MESRYEQIWNDNFEIYKEYVNVHHEFPVCTTEYKGIKIGQWLRNQTSAYNAGKLSKERFEKLNAFHPLWNGSAEEKSQVKKQLLLSSNWREKVPKQHTPIDVFLFDPDVLYRCLIHDIYDFETWMTHYAKTTNPVILLEYYSKVFPFIEPTYALFLCKLENHDISDVTATKEFFDRYQFLSADDMKQRIDRMLRKLDDREQLIIKMSFGLGYEKSYTLNEIGVVLNLTIEPVRKAKNKALEKLKVSSIYQELLPYPIKIQSLKDLQLSARSLNCVYRAGICTVPELIHVIKNEPERLMNTRNVGEKSMEEIICKVNALER